MFIIYLILGGAIGGVIGGHFGNQGSEIIFQKTIKRPKLYGGLIGAFAGFSSITSGAGTAGNVAYGLVMGVILMLIIGNYKKLRGRD